MEMNDFRLKREVERIFNIKGANINEPNVLAALITAASKMARCSDLTTEDMTVDGLLDLYKKNGDDQISSMIGMGPQYVQANIGYVVDFNDFSSASMAYQSNKQTYDQLYSKISERTMTKSVEDNIR